MSSSPDRGVALVTGGAVRVGRAISSALAREGFRVAVNYHRSARQAEDLCADLQATGARARAYRADVTVSDHITTMIETVEADLGSIDLLVNNAAIFERRPFLETDDDVWDRHLALNLQAPFRLCRAVAGRMWQRSGGRVINICGTAGIQPSGDYLAYRVAKAGLDELTRCLAQALAPRVQVNGVAPGAILFPEGTSAQERAEVLARVPAGRTGDPEDVAAVVSFLAGAPDYVTGTIVPVDGGASLVTG